MTRVARERPHLNTFLAATSETLSCELIYAFCLCSSPALLLCLPSSTPILIFFQGAVHGRKINGNNCGSLVLWIH